MIIEIKDISAPGLEPYTSLTDGQIRRTGIVIAESPKVIERALDAGLKPISLLTEKKHIEGDAASIIEKCPELDVYTGEREVLATVTGYTLTRGVLCAFERPELSDGTQILETARRICVIYDICDATNIGVIFRSAAALGFDGVLITPQTCDPFNRRAVRVSMGTVFQVPWGIAPNLNASLKVHSFKTVATALTDDSIYLDEFKVNRERKYAVILGSEGYGLPEDIIKSSDYVVKIPMRRGIDSLNVGAATAIVLWHFR